MVEDEFGDSQDKMILEELVRGETETQLTSKNPAKIVSASKVHPITETPILD